MPEIPLDQKPKRLQGVISAAMAMSTGTFASRVMGLVRDAVIASMFSRTVSDAFIVAFRIPNLFRRVLGEGSLSVAFMPIYIAKQEQENAAAARDLANAVFSLLTVTVGMVCALGIIFMPQLMGVLVSGEGYQAVSGKMEITVALARVTFGFVLLVTLYAYFMAIAQAHGRFLIPGLAPAFFNVGIVVFALLPDPAGAGYWLGWGVLFGGVVQLAMVAWTLKSLGRLPRWIPHVWTPGVRQVLEKMAPGFIGLGVLQLMSIANVYFASQLPEGAHSYVYWADRVLELPQALVAVSLGSALLPRFSELVARGQSERLGEEMCRYLSLLMFVALPAAAGMFALALPITEVLFMRGKFNQQDAQVVAAILQIYAVLLLASSFVRVLVTGFYSVQNTRYPALVSVVVFGIHIPTAWLLTSRYGLNGLVSATTVSGLMNAGLLLVMYNRLVAPLNWGRFFTTVAGMLFPTLMMGLFAHLCFHAFAAVAAGVLPTILAQALAMALTVPLSVLIYGYFSVMLGVGESAKMAEMLSRRVRNARLKSFLERVARTPM
jgi:putative peptidoglycan lipid II flippase